MKKIKYLFLTGFSLFILSGLASNAAATGNAEKGKALSAPCIACHGEKGISISPAFPNIAGQYQDYMIQALKAYRSGKRQNPIMAPMAANLSDQDIENLTAYYASQTGLSVVNKDSATK